MSMWKSVTIRTVNHVVISLPAELRSSAGNQPSGKSDTVRAIEFKYPAEPPRLDHRESKSVQTHFQVSLDLELLLYIKTQTSM